MGELPEKSASGAPIYRHQARKRDFELAIGDAESIDAISAHIAKHIGAADLVYHEIVSDLVHIDLHVVKPTPKRNFYTIVTSGMSDRPMQVPPGCEAYRWAELLICLPPQWPINESKESLNDENNYWPLRWLKILARMPHEYKTWLGPGHTVPNGDPPKSFAKGTKMCVCMLAPLLVCSYELRVLRLPDREILFYAILPLYQEELEFKQRKGANDLLLLFDKANINELLDVRRKNVCKRWFGIF